MSREKEIEGEEGEALNTITKKKHGDNRISEKFLSDDGSAAGDSSGTKPQDADYSISPLCEELQVSILARFPRLEYGKICFINKRFLALVKSGDLFKIRTQIGFKEPFVFILPSGEENWWAFDKQFQSCKKLPDLPSDPCFLNLDKESLCAGTHLIVSGREINGGTIWRYELLENKWFKGPSMINPRCLFASATCSSFGFVAGGIGTESDPIVLDTAEKYDPKTKMWNPLPKMHKRRKLCSGCYMDNKFYVIGGRDEEGKDLKCGEFFDEKKNIWVLIPNMLKDIQISNSSSQSPPLIAVVNNELYSLETSTNELKLYLKINNTWKNLGAVPVRADFNRGWGVAFKSLGNELLVIGASSELCGGNGMSIYTCCPNLESEELNWRLLECRTKKLSHFILNCCVMEA